MVFFELIISVFVKVFTIISKCLHDNLLAYIVNFAKGFEMAIIVIAVTSFLLFNLLSTIRYLKKLPRHYAIEIVDAYGDKTAIEGLRIIFATYDAAESYARFYHDIYKDQYKFRVIGLEE
jgi:hypothetical protein